jgi:hypothetical protein
MSVSDKFSRSVLLGAMMIGTGTASSALTVTRCNSLSDGAYRTVLIVENNGEKSVHPLGDSGLTRSIAYDSDAAIAWAQTTFGGADATYADCAGERGRDEDIVANDDDIDEDDDQDGYGD